jgi:hypothetical protein
MYLGTESFTRQGGTTPWFSRQGQAHIVSTAIRSPAPARGPAEVGGKPLFRPWFSTDPQAASISSTVNISIVFIMLPFNCGGIIHHLAIKNDSGALLRRWILNVRPSTALGKRTDGHGAPDLIASTRLKRGLTQGQNLPVTELPMCQRSRC